MGLPDLERNIHLILFFTAGMSLKEWDKIGIFEREVALYQNYQEQGIKVSFVTYGDECELEFFHKIPGVEILCNKWKKWGLHWRIYATLIPLLHASQLRKADVFKTNQMSGADIALRAARMWNKPLITRCGYMFSKTIGRQYGYGSNITMKARKLEKKVFQATDRILVTTNQMLKDIKVISTEFSKKTNVLPNYVDTEKFLPTETNKDFDILFIGRLSNEKNIASLLEAVMKLKYRIIVIGKGPLEKELKEKYKNLNGLLEWKGNVSNIELPGYMNRSKMFVLPSHYEGHPKALIEAMSCGMPVIGADSPGICDVIRHGENGWLCGTDADSISQVIQNLLEDPNLAQRLGDNARQFVLQNYALEDIVEKELKIIKEVSTLKN